MIRPDHIEYFSGEDLAELARDLVGDRVTIRDAGLLDSAAARPRAALFGEDAYPTMPERAAALMHSIARNYALVDGNKRLAWGATMLFCYLNGILLTPADHDAAFDLVITVAAGELDVPKIAAILTSWMTELAA